MTGVGPSFQANLRNAAWDQMVVKLRSQEQAVSQAKARERELIAQVQQLEETSRRRQNEADKDAASRPTCEQMLNVKADYEAAQNAKCKAETKLAHLKHQNDEIMGLSKRMAGDLNVVQKDLNEARTHLKEKNFQLAALQEQTKQEISIMQNDVANARFELVVAQGELDKSELDAASNVDILKTSLQQIESVALEKERELGVLQGKLDDIEKEKSEVRTESEARCQLLCDDLKRTQALLEESHKEQHQLKDQSVAAEGSLSIQNLKLSELQVELKRTTHALEKANIASHDEHEINAHITSLKSEIAHLKYGRIAMEKVVEELHQEIDDVKEKHRVDIAESKAEGETRLLKLQEEMMIASQAALTRAKHELKSTRARNAEMQSMIAEHQQVASSYCENKASLEQMRERIQSLEEDNTELKVSNQNKTTEVEKVDREQEFQAMESHIRDLDQKNDALRWSHAAVGTELENARLELSERQSVVLEYEKQLVYIQGRLQTSGSDSDRLANEGANLREELETARQKIDSMDTEILDVRAGNVILQTKLETLGDTLSASHLERETLIDESAKACKKLCLASVRHKFLQSRLERTILLAAQDQEEITSHFMSSTISLRKNLEAARSRWVETSQHLSITTAAKLDIEQELNKMASQLEKSETDRTAMESQKIDAEIALAQCEGALEKLGHDFNNALTTHQSDVEQLRDQKVYIEKLTEDVAKERCTVKRTTLSVEQLKEREGSLTKEICELKKCLEAAEGAQKRAEQSEQQLVVESERAASRLQEIETKEKQIAVMQKQLSSSDDSLKMTEKQLEGVRAEHFALELSNKEVVSSLSSARTRLGDREEELRQMSTLSENLETEAKAKLDELFMKYEQECRQSQSLTADLKQAQFSLGRASDANETLLEKKKASEEAMEESRKNQNTLADRLQESRASCAAICRSKDAVAEKFATAMKSIEALEGRVQELTDSASRLGSEKVELEKTFALKIQDRDAKRKTLEKQLSEASSNSASMKCSLSNLQEALDRKSRLMEENSCAMSADKERLEQELLIACQSVEALQTSCKEHEAKSADQRSNFELVQQKMSTLQAQHADALALSVAEHNEQCGTLRQRASEYQALAEKREDELRGAQDTVSKVEAEYITKLSDLREEMSVQGEERKTLLVSLQDNKARCDQLQISLDVLKEATEKTEADAHSKVEGLEKEIEIKEEETINALFKYDTILKKNNKLKLKIRRLEAVKDDSAGQENNIPPDNSGKKAVEVSLAKRRRLSLRSKTPLAVRSDL